MADFRAELTRFLTANQVPDLWAYLLVSPDAPDAAVEERLRERRRWAESHTADTLYGLDAVFLLLHDTEIRRELARSRAAARRREAAGRANGAALPATPTPAPPPATVAAAPDAPPGYEPDDFEDEIPTRVGAARHAPAQVVLQSPTFEDEEVTAVQPSPVLAVPVSPARPPASPAGVRLAPPRSPPVPAGVQVAPRPSAPVPAGVQVPTRAPAPAPPRSGDPASTPGLNRPSPGRPAAPPPRGASVRPTVGTDATMNRPLRGPPGEAGDPPTSPGRAPGATLTPPGSPFRPVAEEIPGVTVTPALPPGVAAPRPTLTAPPVPPPREVSPVAVPVPEAPARVSLPRSTRQHLPLPPWAVVGRLALAALSLAIGVGLTWATFHVKPPGFGGVPMDAPSDED